MDIYILRDKLKRAVRLTEGYRKVLDTKLTAPDLSGTDRIKLDCAVESTDARLAELCDILADAEVCCEQHNEMSWTINPDRSGGQFTQDEIYNSGRDGWIEP